MKKAFSLILAIVMVIGLLVPGVSAAENDEFNVVVSIEGLTLGQGIYVKPTSYTLNQINELVGQKGFGPFTEDNLTAAMATLAFFVDHNIEYTNTGNWDSGFYLSGVKGIDNGVVGIPAFIGENGGPTTAENVGNDDEYLGEFDYGNMAGWMITVNNFMIDVGVSSWGLKDGVASGKCGDYGNTYNVRWQFTVHGYGADLGHSTGWGNEAYFQGANKDLTVSGTEFPAELFTIGFETEQTIDVKPLDIAISGMSVKLTSDSSDEASMVIVNIDNAKGSVNVVQGISFSAVCLYQGDDVDLIPTTKKAVALAVTGVAAQAKVAYNDGTNQVNFLYSEEISNKTGVPSYVALVDSKIDMGQFSKKENYTIEGTADAMAFGDANADGVVNAQDALAAVDTWLRKSEAPSDIQILTLNVNGDSRINTFDALGIVESFVNHTDYAVVTNAAALSTRS